MDAFDRLSGADISVEGVGKVRQPTLEDIRQIGYTTYAMHMGLLLTTKESFVRGIVLQNAPKNLEGASSIDIDAMDEILAKMTFGMFSVLMSEPLSRAALMDALSFFVRGDLSLTREMDRIDVYAPDEDGTCSLTGSVTDESYDRLQAVLSDIVSFPGTANKKPKSFRSEKVRKLWLRLEAIHARQSEQGHKKGLGGASVPAMISAVATYSHTYNYSNIWGLTLYQLYDQFIHIITEFQLGVYGVRWGAWGKEEFDISPLYKDLSETAGE